MKSWRPGHSDATQLVKQRPNKTRIDPVDEAAQPALARNVVMKLRELPQKMQVMLALGGNIVKIVAARDGGTDHQQQDLRERIDDAPWLTVIGDCRKMVHSKAKRARGLSPSKIGSMIALQCESERPRNHTAASTQNCPDKAVNLSSEP